MILDRRDFLTAAALAGVASLLPSPAAAEADPAVARAKAYAAALRERPWLLGWRSVMGEQVAADPGEIEVQGRIPADLQGTLYRNGPAVHEIGGQRYRHWFDGDGLVQAFRFADGRVSHRARVVDTPKRRAERAAGRMLYPAFDTMPPDPAPMNGPDTINVANISVLDHGGRLMALWEGGSAVELDRDGLGFRDFVAWSAETRGLPFSAHPRVDRDGTLWSFGYAGYADRLVVYRIGADGRLRDVRAIEVAPTPMVHDFMVTERHVVFVLAPFVYDRSRSGTFLERHAWRPERGGRALILAKDDLSAVREVELPAFWVYHFANAWEDEAGRIRFDFARYPDPLLTTDGLRAVMRGETGGGSGAVLYAATVDPARGRYDEAPLQDAGHSEFPRIDPRRAGRRHRTTYALGREPGDPAQHPMFTRTIAVDLDTGRIDGFRHGDAEIPEETVFVPRGPADGAEGWLVQTVLDVAEAKTRLKVFDAARLADGPIAVATLPYALPLGLHGTFVATA